MQLGVVRYGEYELYSRDIRKRLALPVHCTAPYLTKPFVGGSLEYQDRSVSALLPALKKEICNMYLTTVLMYLDDKSKILRAILL